MKKILAIIIALTLAGTSFASARTYTKIIEKFSSYGEKDGCIQDGAFFGPWENEWSGYGCVSIETINGNEVLSEKPKTSTRANEYHSALVLGPQTSGSLTFRVKLQTAEQLRENTPSDPWETATVAWNYHEIDNNGQTENQFYYFNPKPNGWELTQVNKTIDPETGEYLFAGGQRFLATGTDKKFPIQTWYDIRIIQIGKTIRVYVDGEKIVTYRDTEYPYTQGRVGLYTEQAHAYYDDVKIYNKRMRL